MSYRVEISPNARAACASTKCKKDQIKIQKGEVRQATMVMFKEHQSWKYRHWGCVTPTVLHNWWENAEQNTELIDGFDELPEEVQDKVRTALEAGHVEDEEWNGDIECNRYDPSNKSQGMFLKGARLKAKQAAEATEDETSSPSKKASKKRSRATADDTEQKPTKKSKAVKKEDDEENTKPTKKSTKPKKSAAVAEDEDDLEEPVAKKPSKSTKSKKTAAESNDAPKQTKSRKVKTEVDEEDEEMAEPAPVKKSRAKKVKVEDDLSDEEAEPATKPKSRAKKQTKSAETVDAVETEKPAPRRKKASRGN